MPPIAMVRSVHSEVDGGGHQLLTMEVVVYDWVGGWPQVMINVAPPMLGMVIVPDQRERVAEEPAPASPCLPLPAPIELTRWQLLEVDK